MRKTVSIVAIVVGIVMAVAGVVTWVAVTSTLSEQNIVVAQDADCMAGRAVHDPLSAYCEARVIDKHMKQITGGKTYAQLDQEDPNRPVAADAAFLQASLFTSVLVFGVAAMAVAVGIVLALIGFTMRPAKRDYYG